LRCFAWIVVVPADRAARASAARTACFVLPEEVSKARAALTARPARPRGAAPAAPAARRLRAARRGAAARNGCGLAARTAAATAAGG